MGGYKYRIGTHNGASSSNPESTQLLKVVENDDGATMGGGRSASSSWSSKVVATSIVTFVGVSCVMAVQQKMGAGSSVSTVDVVPEPGVPTTTTTSGTNWFASKTAGWTKGIFPSFRRSGDDGENNNLSSLLGSEHYTLKDVADSFRQLEYERDKTRGQSNSLHVFSWTPQAGFEMFDLGPSKEAAMKDASIDRWQRPGWTFDFIKKGLQTYFPKRFDGVHDPRPFRVVISHADYQTIPCSNPNNNKKCAKLPAPVFTFGSVPTHVDRKMENLKQMPTFSTLECLWGHMTAKSEPEHGKCRWFVPQTKYEGHCEDKSKENWSFLDAGEVQLWDNVPFNTLTPKVVWRGADYPFVAAFSNDDAGQTAALFFKRNARLRLQDKSAAKVIETVGEQNLPPRLHAALLSKAEPNWMDVKFLRPKVIPGFGDIDDQYKGLETVEPMTKCEMARFKYHIDIGGNGGTTWQGTIDKLAMPGLLFHHDSGMKDHFHDELKPWVHYVPVAVDLTDLKIKYEWAERNPEKAEKIAKNGQEWVRNFISEKGMEEQVQNYFVQPMTDYIAKYDDDCEVCTKERMSFAQKVHAVTDGSMSAAKMSWSKRNELQK
ncbi:predicted protein [Bathycoccus prasinos]|uniref:Glycosyl transferase CAP10 domain-containing protein n=1 Tax=Bathycoccus prasinos TaxID=41875 RepID=K8EQI8_9CHLO|nr:predicted protein [Bathycoccus prasinos]CCO20497.1 predicted protein [Bathycoccus prasinos]|eukprot:XP_007508393.1 predicted protein [Bathycoccus prasinos]